MARRNNGTIKGGAPRKPTMAVDTGNAQDARGKSEGQGWNKVSSHARRYRNPKHGPKGTNPEGVAAQKRARNAAKRRD